MVLLALLVILPVKNSAGPSELVICRLRSASMIQVPIIVNGYKISAVLDTAAEVTILSDRLLKLLDEKPKISKPVIMHAAGRDMQMKGAKLEPVRMKLGEGWYCESLYMAPIEDDMLLGLDFLLKYQAKVNLSGNYLEIGKEKVSIIMGKIMQ